MKVLKLVCLLLTFGVANATKTTACNADNCARAITGTRTKSPNLAARRTDCSNFMTTTVYATPTATTTPAVIYNRRVKRDEVVKRGSVTVSGTVPAYATDCTGAPAYSSACSCWGITATVITVATPTTTVAAPGPTCYKGLQYAFYGFTQGSPASAGVLPYNNGDYESVFSTDTFIGVTPDDTGVTSEAGGVNNGCASGLPLTIYGSTMSNVDHSDYIGLDHRGYFHPIEAGAYTFTIEVADEIGLIWLGSNAVSGWTLANANLVVQDGQGSASYTYTATGGEYVPIRIMYANAQGCALFYMQVVKPDGITIILDEASSFNDYFLQYCVGEPGTPNWPAWQSET